jgi:cell division protein ZapE
MVRTELQVRPFRVRLKPWRLDLALPSVYPPSMPPSLSAAYDRRLADGDLTADAGQRMALDHLDRLLGDLAAADRPALFRKAMAPRGLYLWGPVGRGKSMLMDMFFEAAPMLRKRRAHFHAFMAEVHHLMNAWRSGTPASRRARFGHGRGDDPIPPLADLIVKDARLLCFDELQVTDIADAMILGRLFQALFERGVTLVSTSNRPPDDLYRDGINRQLFLPFIVLLKTRMEIVEIAGPIDHRGVEARRRQAWFSPIDPDNEREFDALWLETLAGARETGVTLEVLGRKEHWPRASDGRLRAHFASLCAHALGPEDYLAIAEAFQIVFLEAVPRMGPERRNEARRFATLIDTLYEARARLVVLAAGEPETLYPSGDLAFEFERTVSRLREMRSASWLEGG